MYYTHDFSLFKIFSYDLEALDNYCKLDRRYTYCKFVTEFPLCAAESSRQQVDSLNKLFVWPAVTHG